MNSGGFGGSGWFRTLSFIWLGSLELSHRPKQQKSDQR